MRGQKQMKLDELPLYDFKKLETATNNFHIDNMLGKGGFGPVYKVILSKILYVIFCIIYHKFNIKYYSHYLGNNGRWQ
jgi:hypothetical protein